MLELKCDTLRCNSSMTEEEHYCESCIEEKGNEKYNEGWEAAKNDCNRENCK